jgi:hypothetical protein
MHLHASVFSDTEPKGQGAKGKGSVTANLRVVLDGSLPEDKTTYVKYELRPYLLTAHTDGITRFILRAVKDRREFEVFSIPIDELFQDEAGPRGALFRHLGEKLLLT